MSDELRLYAITSREVLAKLNGARGKLAAQSGHAYLHSFWDAEKRFPKIANQYRHSQAAVKVCLVCDTDAELEAIYLKYQPLMGATRVVDAGRTVFNGPTLTFVGLGPCPKSVFDLDVSDLKGL
jgi:peptidyl-tRNA hydrolase